MTCKATWFFRDIASSTDNGWTESFYLAASDSTTGMAAVSDPAWLNQRLAFLPSSYMLSSIRVQNVASRFDNARRRYTNQTGVGQFPVGGRNQPDGESPWQGLLLRLRSGTDVIRNFTLRGLTSDVLGDNLEYQAPPAWDTAFQNWLRQLGTSPQAYQLRKMTLNQGYAPPVSITVLADRKTITLDFTGIGVPAALIKGAVFFIDGVQSATPFAGLWRVRSSGFNSVTCFPRRRTIFGTPTAGTGLRVMQFSYFTINGGVVTRGGERKAGRPFDLLRGRARAR